MVLMDGWPQLAALVGRFLLLQRWQLFLLLTSLNSFRFRHLLTYIRCLFFAFDTPVFKRVCCNFSSHQQLLSGVSARSPVAGDMEDWQTERVRWAGCQHWTLCTRSRLYLLEKALLGTWQQWTVLYWTRQSCFLFPPISIYKYFVQHLLKAPIQFGINILE